MENTQEDPKPSESRSEETSRVTLTIASLPEVIAWTQVTLDTLKAIERDGKDLWHTLMEFTCRINFATPFAGQVVREATTRSRMGF